jgi:hypothetical protein
MVLLFAVLLGGLVGVLLLANGLFLGLILGFLLGLLRGLIRLVLLSNRRVGAVLGCASLAVRVTEGVVLGAVARVLVYDNVQTNSGTDHS